MKRGDGSEAQRAGGKAPIYRFHILCFLLLNSEKRGVYVWSMVGSQCVARKEGGEKKCMCSIQEVDG